MRWMLVVFYIAVIYATLPVTRALVDKLRDLGLIEAALAFGFAVTGGFASRFIWPAVKSRAYWHLVLMSTLGLGIGIWARSLPAIEERIHLAEYALLALLVSHAAEQKFSGVRLTFLTLLIACGLGALDEGLQGLIPSRVFDWRDIGFNAGASALGALFASVGGDAQSSGAFVAAKPLDGIDAASERRGK